MKYLLLIVLMMTGCAMQQTNSASLYSRIGGKPMLAMISSETIDIIANNPKTMRSFDGVKLQPIKDSITDFLCVKTGGQCVYEGETMVNSHAEAEITSAEFELMVQVMRDVLDANRIADREKNELLRILAPMKKEIVTK